MAAPVKAAPAQQTKKKSAWLLKVMVSIEKYRDIRHIIADMPGLGLKAFVVALRILPTWGLIRGAQGGVKSIGPGSRSPCNI